MATHNVNLNEKGTPDPRDIGVINRGDIVSFSVGSVNIVLCLPAAVFGAERIEIPAGNTAAVGIKPDARLGFFKYWCCDAKTINKRTCGEVETESLGDPGTGTVGG